MTVESLCYTDLDGPRWTNRRQTDGVRDGCDDCCCCCGPRGAHAGTDSLPAQAVTYSSQIETMYCQTKRDSRLL
jgi:hypothetical protein